MRNLKLTIAYDGSRYFGWQKTSTGPSIQEELELALLRLLGSPHPLEAASRTDRGVHAKGQSVHFLTSHPIELRRLQGGLNAILPKDISIQSIQEMAHDFHPTLDAKGKEYRYFICNQPVQSPIHRFYSWHLHEPLDLGSMQQAADQLVGKKDFAAFTNERTDDSIRTIRKLSIASLDNNRYCIEIQGDNFLYKMARNLTGAIIRAGQKRIDPFNLKEIIESKDRKKAPLTAPAHGLFLWRVIY